MQHIKLCEECGGLMETDNSTETKCKVCKAKPQLLLPANTDDYLWGPLGTALNELKRHFVR